MELQTNPTTKSIEIKEAVYKEDEIISEKLKKLLAEKNCFSVNLLGGPGIGKTSSLIALLKRLKDWKPFVLEADIESDLDTKTLNALGVETQQVNTHGACHLESPTIESILPGFSFFNDPKGEKRLMVIENIGNLVCPAEFVIGEHIKLLVVATTDGSDKPYKYPLAFEKADMMLVNKMDLAPYVSFDREYFEKGVRALNPDLPIFYVSAKTEEGFDEAAEYLRAHREEWMR